ncbi:MAG TPA: MraY family glycosyltransferase [Candidatus Polarisedimenticolia bacterium]|nr:MraY family glycosyltransferase [Candidatus Polarisedimenticolia bacterium]
MPVLALLAVGVWLLARPPGGGAPEIALVAFLAAFGLTPFVSLVARRGGALDLPDARKKHGAPTPKLGGVAVISAFVLAMGRTSTIDRTMLCIAAAALALMLAGAVDDTRGLSARLRLGLQLVCALLVIGAGVRLNLLPGAAGAAANVLLSIVWIVGITNAYNFIDGMDGLAASLGALIAMLLGLVAQSSGQGGLAAACAALAGALLGFLPHNLRATRPASIFLGDSGSASVGFLLASLAIKEDWAEGDPLVALATPVLIFSVLIYDMIQTTVSRVASGRVRSFRQWIDFVGRDHIHHRFADLLGNQKRALALILALALGLGLSALGLRRGDGPVAFIFLVHGALVLLVVAVLEGSAARTGSRRSPPSPGGASGREGR